MTPEPLMAALAPLAASLGWPLRSFTRGEELIAVAALDHDPAFEHFLWVLHEKDATLRCMLVSRAAVPSGMQGAILEACARINDGLIFGCAEYSFHDRTVIFRDSADLAACPAEAIVPATTARVLDLGSRYSPAVAAVLAGTSPAEAVASAEEKSSHGRTPCAQG